MVNIRPFVTGKPVTDTLVAHSQGRWEAHRHALLNDEGGDAMCALLRLGLGIDHQGIGHRAVGAPTVTAQGLCS